MITIEHYGSEYPPMVSWSIRDAMVGETAEHMGTYWSGIQPPNFPVPALVNIWIITYQLNYPKGKPLVLHHDGQHLRIACE